MKKRGILVYEVINKVNETNEVYRFLSGKEVEYDEIIKNSYIPTEVNENSLFLYIEIDNENIVFGRTRAFSHKLNDNENNN